MVFSATKGLKKVCIPVLSVFCNRFFILPKVLTSRLKTGEKRLVWKEKGDYSCKLRNVLRGY